MPVDSSPVDILFSFSYYLPAGAFLARKAQTRDASSTFWPEIPTVRRGARRLGIRPEAALGLRLITFNRGFAPPERYPVASPGAPEAPR